MFIAHHIGICQCKSILEFRVIVAKVQEKSEKEGWQYKHGWCNFRQHKNYTVAQFFHSSMCFTEGRMRGWILEDWNIWKMVALEVSKFERNIWYLSAHLPVLYQVEAIRGEPNSGKFQSFQDPFVVYFYKVLRSIDCECNLYCFLLDSILMTVWINPNVCYCKVDTMENSIFIWGCCLNYVKKTLKNRHSSIQTEQANGELRAIW